MPGARSGATLWERGSQWQKRIKAINALRPRLKRLPPVDEHQLAEYIAGRSNLSKADVTHALLELSAGIEDFIALGHSVRLTGLGLVTPSMNTQGEITIRILPDVRLVRALNSRGRFQGKVINARNLRKSGAELVAQWDELHPDDPVAP
jgi:hypothetical protein